MTDAFPAYFGLDYEFAEHGVVNHHRREFGRGDISTNAVEGYFANLKRGIDGVYHHVSDAHIHRYLSEFDFRYGSRDVNDGVRTAAALAGAEGKRLKYRDTQPASQ